MARNLRCNLLGTLTLFLATAGFAAVSPALARDAEHAFMPMYTTAPMIAPMALLRPQPRPDAATQVAFEVTRGTIAAPVTILAPEAVDRSRIRTTWAIGVFR